LFPFASHRRVLLPSPLAPIQLAGRDVAAGGGRGRGGAAAGAWTRGAAARRRPGPEHRRHRANGGVLVLRGQVLRAQAAARGARDAHVQPLPEGRANGENALGPCDCYVREILAGTCALGLCRGLFRCVHHW
jgi:hypothetical protein